MKGEELRCNRQAIKPSQSEHIAEQDNPKAESAVVPHRQQAQILQPAPLQQQQDQTPGPLRNLYGLGLCANYFFWFLGFG